MGIYDRAKAADYARKWALGRNPDFHDFGGNAGGGDCANFVSQCLLAGGMPQVLGMYADVTAWYSSKRLATWSWSAARNLQLHLKELGRASRCERDEVEVGDVVFLELGRSVLHSMFVTGVFKARHLHPQAVNEVFLSYHSRNVLHRPLYDIEKEFRGESDGDRAILTFWKIRDLIPPPPKPMTMPSRVA